MADREHLEIVRAGVQRLRRWRAENSEVILNLEGAVLDGLELNFADLHGAYLGGCSFIGAKLSFSNLSTAQLPRANLTGARLELANFSLANATDAIFKNARLSGAVFHSTFVDGADFSEAHFGVTAFSRLNLTSIKGLETVEHGAPSSIGIDTVAETLRASGGSLSEPVRSFIVGAGVPGPMLDSMLSLLRDVRYQTSFISYGEPDHEIAERLYRALTDEGASCWMYALDRTAGERTWPEITQNRRNADKMVLLCSADALVRDGVLKEIEEQVDDDPNKIIVVSLDNLWLHPGFSVRRGERNLKPYLQEKNYVDCSTSGHFARAVEELLRALRVPD